MLKLSIVLAVAFSLSVPPRGVGTTDVDPPHREATYAVIVNANNATKASGDDAMKMVKNLYLKDLTRWSDGVEAKPYGRETRSAEHAAFLKTVLGMSEAELARHWLRQKNMSGTTPPKEVDGDRLLVKHVAKHDGAFGVVKLKCAKADGVRILFEFNVAP